jgi:hypothetical protein
LDILLKGHGAIFFEFVFRETVTFDFPLFFYARWEAIIYGGPEF